MATYNKQSLIDNTVANDEWLSKAILRIAHLHHNETFKLSGEDLPSLNYWTGWVRGNRHLSGRHRDDAVAFVKRKDITDALWRDALERRLQQGS